MTGNQITFKLANNLSELKKLSRRLEAFAKRHHLFPKDIYAINLCVEEHFANLISHGYTDSKPHGIEITLSVENEIFMVRAEDDGAPFNPIQIPSPDIQCPLEERKIGGLGVYLTRHFMDMMRYERRGNKNVLVMAKKIDRQA